MRWTIIQIPSMAIDAHRKSCDGHRWESQYGQLFIQNWVFGIRKYGTVTYNNNEVIIYHSIETRQGVSVFTRGFVFPFLKIGFDLPIIVLVCMVVVYSGLC